MSTPFLPSAGSFLDYITSLPRRLCTCWNVTNLNIRHNLHSPVRHVVSNTEISSMDTKTVWGKWFFCLSALLLLTSGVLQILSCFANLLTPTSCWHFTIVRPSRDLMNPRYVSSICFRTPRRPNEHLQSGRRGCGMNYIFEMCDASWKGPYQSCFFLVDVVFQKDW